MSRHIHVIGIGAGNPDYLTVQAIEALNDTQVFFAMDKGEAKSDLVALRREICARFIREPGYRFVELPDPKRSTDADYREAVSDWHAARARIWATAIAAELGPDGVGRLPGLGRPVAVRQHAAHPGRRRGRGRFHLRRHSGHHRGAGADGSAPHPAQRGR